MRPKGFFYEYWCTVRFEADGVCYCADERKVKR